MGTELQNRGFELPLPLWSAMINTSHHEIITEIHSDYIKAGANIITANTFRTTSWTFEKAGYSRMLSKEQSRTSLYKAVECAQKAVINKEKIAGSITTIADCYKPQEFPGRIIAADIYGQTLEWMVDAGVDIILFETMGNADEIVCALEIAKNYNHPIWISLIAKDKKHILDGTPLKKMIQLLQRFPIDYLLTNCNGLSLSIDTSSEINSEWDGYWGVYPNLGYKDLDNDYTNIVDDGNFKKNILSLLSKEPNILGLCCGSTPQHLKQIIKIINLEG